VGREQLLIQFKEKLMSWKCEGSPSDPHPLEENEDDLSCSNCGLTLEEISGNGGKRLRRPTPIVPIAIASFVLAGLGAGISNFVNKTSVPNTITSVSTSSGVSAHISFGEKLLLNDNPSVEKQDAVKAFAVNDYPAAISKLETSLKAKPNDPEALIYLNNARLGTKEAYQIAAVVPIGRDPNPALELLRGVAQAQDEAIKAGMLIKVAIADDNNDPKRSEEIASTLVKNQDILAVVGHGTSKTSLAAAPIYSQNQLLMIAPTSSTSELTQLHKSSSISFVYRTIASDKYTGAALANFMLKVMGKKNAIVFYNSGSSYSESLRSAFSNTLLAEGGKIDHEVDLSKGNQTPPITSEVLVLLPDSDSMPEAMAIAKANQNRLPLLGGDAVYRFENLQDAGQSLNGMVLSTPWHPYASSDTVFPKTSQNLWGAQVNWRTALSYDAMQVLRTAISIGLITPKSGVQGRKNLAVTLAKSTFEADGATGKIKFLSSGDRNSQVILLQVKSGKSSGTGFDFLPIK